MRPPYPLSRRHYGLPLPAGEVNRVPTRESTHPYDPAPAPVGVAERSASKGSRGPSAGGRGKHTWRVRPRTSAPGTEDVARPELESLGLKGRHLVLLARGPSRGRSPCIMLLSRERKQSTRVSVPQHEELPLGVGAYLTEDGAEMVSRSGLAQIHPCRDGRHSLSQNQ